MTLYDAKLVQYTGTMEWYSGTVRDGTIEQYSGTTTH